MQAMLRMIGYGENLGSGFPLILSAWNEKHWLKPELIEQPELMQVKLILHIENIGDDPKSGTKDGTKDGTKNLSERQVHILDLIRKEPTMTSSDLTHKLGVSQRTLMRELSALQDKGVITREGGKTYGKWIIKTDE